MRKLAFWLAAMGVVVLSSGASSMEAQQAIDSQWAEQFIGSWEVRLDTPDGEVPLVVNVRQDGGNVVIALGNQEGEAPPITNVTRAGESLVASYEMDYQGMPIDATLSLRRAGDGLDTNWSFAGGAYETSAEGTRR